MRKRVCFSILYSFHGEKSPARDRGRILTRHLQSCGRDRGWPDITTTPDTLCGWHGCKANRVAVKFPNVCCWLRFTCHNAQMIFLRNFYFLFRTAYYMGKFELTTPQKHGSVTFSWVLFWNSLIIHQVITKKITIVKEVNVGHPVLISIRLRVVGFCSWNLRRAELCILCKLGKETRREWGEAFPFPPRPRFSRLRRSPLALAPRPSQPSQP